MQQLAIPENSKAIGKRIVELAFPATVNILAVKRGEMYIAPNGSTILQLNDVLSVLAEDKKSLALLLEALGIPK
jgi:cell volume regulation protein A